MHTAMRKSGKRKEKVLLWGRGWERWGGRESRPSAKGGKVCSLKIRGEYGEGQCLERGGDVLITRVDIT